MRLPAAARSSLRFNITPMIDVVFLLIIFFLVASYFIRSEQSRTVALPEAGGGLTDESATEQRLTITIESNGTMSIGAQPVSIEAVLSRIQDLAATAGDAQPPEVRIRMDRDARFGEARVLIEACAERGIGRIRFAVVQAAAGRAADSGVQP